LDECGALAGDRRALAAHRGARIEADVAAQGRDCAAQGKALAGAADADAADVICRQSASGATSRSTPRALAAFAAGQICRPSEDGTARAAPALQLSGKATVVAPGGPWGPV
jgi:hypothetical protein